MVNQLILTHWWVIISANLLFSINLSHFCYSLFWHFYVISPTGDAHSLMLSKKTQREKHKTKCVAFSHQSPSTCLYYSTKFLISLRTCDQQTSKRNEVLSIYAFIFDQQIRQVNLKNDFLKQNWKNGCHYIPFWFVMTLQLWILKLNCFWNSSTNFSFI